MYEATLIGSETRVQVLGKLSLRPSTFTRCTDIILSWISECQWAALTDFVIVFAGQNKVGRFLATHVATSIFYY